MPIRNNKGFTLIELLVATSILATIFSMIFAVFFNIIDGKEGAEKTGNIYQTVRAIFEIMEKDIRASVLLGSNQSPCCFSGMDLEEGGEGMDTLRFTFLSIGGIFQEEGDTDQRFVEYRPEYNPEEKSTTLFRVEVPYLNKTPDLFDVEKVDIGIDLFGVNLRYFDGNVWKDVWEVSGLAGKNPTAVEIELITKDRFGEKIRLTNVVRIESHGL